MEGTTDQAAFRRAVADVPGFTYRNGLSLVLLSLGWFVASLPLVTIGPATLAAYVAIQDLRSDRNRIDRDRIVSVLRQNGVASVLFSGVPIAFGAVAVAYGTTAFAQESLVGEGIALVAAYVALYVTLALVPTFTALARGIDPVRAFRYGLGWLANHPTPALAVGLLTLVVLGLTVLLTVAFVLVFAGLAFSLHVGVVETVERQASEPGVSQP